MLQQPGSGVVLSQTHPVATSAAVAAREQKLNPFSPFRDPQQKQRKINQKQLSMRSGGKPAKPGAPKKIYNTFDSEVKPSGNGKGSGKVSGGLSRDSKSITENLDQALSKQKILSQKNEKTDNNAANILSGNDERTS